MESVVNTLRNTKGERIGLLAVMRDISQRVKDREALAEGERQKDHFLATLAHELRNPLAPLMNGLQLLDGDALDPDTLSATQAMMQRQLDQLVRLVDDLMDLGRISRGKLELQKEELDLADVLSVAMETSRSIIDRRDHQLIVDVVSGPFPVFGDATRLAQILANLLNNAAKYTPCGGVITVSMRADQSQVDVRVCDTGIGIAPDQLDRIFDMFAQVEGPSSDAGGLGIGLNLSQRLAHLHRGELMATSDGLDQGSCFTLQLPLANAEPVVPIVAEMPDATLPDALRILVVDDNEDVATTTVMLLSKLGQRAQAAFNGAQAIRTGAELQPHLVLMDLGMPGLSGHETCAQMRATAWGRDIKIVAISGWGQESDRAKSRDAGFDEHFVKPMELRSIKRLLRELTGATDQHSHD
jgi:CheY-like chemotaxis protein